MAKSKLLKRLFKRHIKRDDGNDENTSSLHSAPSSSTLSPPTRRLLVQNLEHHAQLPSLFFSLPGELRNKIYLYATYPSMLSVPIYRSPESVLSANIFHICRRIRSEVISHLCASKSFNLFNLRVANEFFELVRDGLPSLRSVTIRCPIVWRLETEEVKLEKSDLLGYLELATGLVRLSIVIEGPLPDVQRGEDLADPESVGTRFFHAVRDVVDRETRGMQETRETNQEPSILCKQLGVRQGVQIVKGHEQGGNKVFRLCTSSHTDCWALWSANADTAISNNGGGNEDNNGG